MKSVAGFILLAILAVSYSTRNSFQASGDNEPPGKPPVKQRAKASAQPRKTHKPAAPSECDLSEAGALQCTMAEYFGWRWGTEPALDISNKDLNPNTRLVIATVPDPVHTSLALLFDRSLDAIQEGAQAAHYTFDRALLPWRPKSEANDPDDSQNESKVRRDRENDPGLLIFRNLEDRKADLFVLLVGETPTSGIHKEQFNRALDIVNRANALTSSPKSRIDIIGPTFSGSFASLQKLIETAEDASLSKGLALYFHIRSGTAMSADAIHEFTNFLALPAGNPGAARGDFYTFNDLDKCQINHFAKFVADQGYGDDKIAVLSEDETAYGSGALSSAPSGESSKEGICDLLPPSNLVSLYFPRKFSELRDAYQKDPVLSSSSSDANIPRTTLKLDYSTSARDEDGVAVFSPKLTPLSQESVMLGIVTRLRIESPRFVILRVTDPLDSLFLTRFLLGNYPQGRVVTLGADQLLPRDKNDTTFRGVLALTNYPLLPSGLTETDGNNGRIVFPASPSVGLFNATLSLLWHDSVSPSGDVLSEPFAEYAPIGSAGPVKPMLWLTAIGDDGYWPYAALASDTVSKSTLPPCDTCKSTSTIHLNPSAPNRIIITALLMCSGVFVWYTWKGSLRGVAFSHQLGLLTDTPRGMLIAVAASALIVLCLLISISRHDAGRAVVAVPLMLSATLIAVSTFLNLRFRGQPRSAVFFASSAAVLIFTLLYWTQKDLSLSEQMFFYRSSWLFSGISPTMPLLLIVAGLLWWVWYMLKVRSLFDVRRPLLPPAVRGFSSAHTLPDDQEVNSNGSRYIVTARTAFWLSALFLVVLLAMLKFFPRSLEGKVFDWTYLALFVGCVLLIVNAVFNAWDSWQRCRNLLVKLDRTPLRWAFRRIHCFSWEPLWGFAGGSLESAYKPLIRSLEALRHLERALEAKGWRIPVEQLQPRKVMVDGDLSQLRLTLARSANTGKFRELRQYQDATLHQMHIFQKDLAVLCSLVWLWILQEAWSDDTRPVTSGQEKDPDEKSAIARAASGTLEPDSHEVQLAEEFVALFYINYIHRALVRIRWLILSASGVFVFLLFSASAYPFQPKTTIHAFLVVLFLGVATVVWMIFGDMHRDSTLSHLTDTTPGKLGSDFWIRIVSFGAVPALSLLAAVVPTLNRFVFTFVKPTVDALHK
jgi:hypothetical protein